MGPKVSVIIPVYNVEKYLRQCLDSVVNQTLRDLEIICVDDGSTDGSSAILAEYAAKDARLKVITRAHTNAGAARNAGMAVATGKYLAFVDSDDWCELTLYEKAYAAARKADTELVFWRYALRDSDSGEIRQEGLFGTEYKREMALLSYSLAPWSRLVLRDLVRREQISFQEIERSNDVYFGGMTMMLARTAVLVDEVLYNYRTGMVLNLQANNARTPCAVVDAWRLLVGEWRKRAIEIPERTVYSAALASIFYTLGSLRNSQAYNVLWNSVKELLGRGRLFESVKTELLSNERLREMWADLQSSTTAFEYLVRRQWSEGRRLSSAWYLLNARERELAAAQKARRINWQEVQSLNKALAAKEMECQHALRRVAEVETSAQQQIEACERELAAAQKARRINWQEVQSLNRELAEKEDECQDSLRRIAEFESSWLCRLSLSLVRRLKKPGIPRRGQN